MICTLDTCDRPAYARDWCRRHYENWRLRGDPLQGPPPRRQRRPPYAERPKASSTIPVAHRFWSKVDFSNPDGCWPWTGSYRHRYGEFWMGTGKLYAHRVAAMLVFGELEDGEVVLHLCDNPACVRPDHLSIGVQADNTYDMGLKGRWKNQHASGANHPEMTNSNKGAK